MDQNNTEEVVNKRIQLKINPILAVVVELNKFKFQIEELIAKLTQYCNTEDAFYKAELADVVIDLGQTIQGLSKQIRSVSVEAFFKKDSKDEFNKFMKEYKKEFKEKQQQRKFDPFSPNYEPKKYPKWLDWEKKYIDNGRRYLKNPSKDYIKDYLTKPK